MVDRIEMMTMRNVGVMSCRLVSTLFVMLGCFLMMLRSLLMMFSGFLVVLRTFMFRHTYCSPFESVGYVVARRRQTVFLNYNHWSKSFQRRGRSQFRMLRAGNARKYRFPIWLFSKSFGRIVVVSSHLLFSISPGSGAARQGSIPVATANRDPASLAHGGDVAAPQIRAKMGARGRKRQV